MNQEEHKPMAFYGTTCCALIIASLQDYHTFEEIRGQIHHFRKEAYRKNWFGKPNGSGQRSMMVIVSPGEDNLESNLKRLGFQLLTDKMPRRNGYPKGALKMYMLSW